MRKILILIITFFTLIGTSSFAANYITDIKVTQKPLAIKVEIKTSSEIEYTVGKLPANKKIYFDFQDTIIREKKNIAVDDERMTGIRAAQNATNPKYISRVVLDMKKMEDFYQSLSEDKKTLTIIFGAVSTFSEEYTGPKKIIVIDPGHGGKDPGAVISDLTEKTLNLDISKRVQQLLKNDSRFEVYMTRENDTFIELIDRANFANEKKADLFVCIHHNSMPKNYSGTMLLYNSTKNPKNKEIADSFQEIIQKASGLTGIGSRLRENLVVLKNIEMPGVLVEVACMSNIKDRREIRKESFKKNMAQAIYDAIVKNTF